MTAVNSPLFLKSMDGNKGTAECPACSSESKRLFLPPNLYSMSYTLKSRIEKGMEPRRMTREELGTRRIPKKSRLWQTAPGRLKLKRLPESQCRLIFHGGLFLI